MLPHSPMDSLISVARRLAPLSMLFVTSLLVLPFASLSVAHAAATVRLELKSNYTLMTARQNVVEATGTELRSGTIVMAYADAPASLHELRDEKGAVRFSSTGFVRIDSLIFVPGIDTDRMDALNRLGGGLYVSAAAVQDIDDPNHDFAPIEPGQAEPGYLQFFSAEGKPRAGYTTHLKKRFTLGFNGILKREPMTYEELEKWDRIYAQLVRVGDRTKPSNRSLLMMDRAEAKHRSVAFEKQKTVSLQGAWSIAVWGTATRHGFQNVPCAEFMSEIIRQAYARAGYSHFDDFNDQRKNRLDFANEASAVQTLAVYLHRAGWIPWDSADYIPMTGAIAMHRLATTPGHTYMIAGDAGRFIVDNGRPQGRDLRTTSARTIQLMYQHGIFFLPPGRTPNRWPDSSARN